MKSKKWNLVLALLLIASFTVQAQITDKPNFGKIAIVDATIHTVTDGTIKNGVIMLDGEKIGYVGTDRLKVSDEYHIIQASGKHVYPGFMDSGTSLGLVEINAVAVTVDNREVGNMNPNMFAFTAFNPHSVSIPVTRVSGVTHVITAPQGGLVSGQAALMDLWGYSPDSMAIDITAGIVLNWPSIRSRGRGPRNLEQAEKRYKEAIRNLNKLLDNARFYEQMMSEYEADAFEKIKPEKNQQLQTMRALVKGETPLIIAVSSEKDILNAIEWALHEDNIPLNIIFAGVEEGWRVAEQIAKAEIPCLVSTLYTPVRSYDHIHRPYENPSALLKAGVKVAIMTGEVENVRNLPFNAGYAAAYGMGTEEAIKAVTINPAEIFGVSSLLGSLEEGKQANLFISSGDPFEPLSQIEQVFIKGYQIPMDSRHTQLFEEFLDRDATQE
ncbi:MAG: amidohydrolase [Balneola sp.]|nr:amidohydrolase [Balneola sp.]|tara:strand:- start:4417 stop:5736 length:1320 start_codon:yes stop_codon:yes gene_type:complete